MIPDNRIKAVSQTLARGLRVLDLIGAADGPITTREVAAGMRLPRSVVQRLLSTLEAEGQLERNLQQGGYRLSLKMWSLGCAAIRSLDVREVARPFLQELSQRSQETVKLGVLEGIDVVSIDTIVSPQTVRAYVPVGGRVPAHASATGRAILAFIPEEPVLPSGYRDRRYSDRTAVDSAALADALKQVRRRGYAINHGELSADTGAVAGPVFDSSGKAVASVGIILPIARLTSSNTPQFGTWVAAAGAEISARLGYRIDEAPRKLKRA